MVSVKSFRQWLFETPHETNNPVPVSNYLPTRPQLSLQPLIPDIVTAVKNGTLKPREMQVPIRPLVPTQNTVSEPKVLNTMQRAVDKLPLVLINKGELILLDGHHRICAEVKKGLARARVYTITISQLEQWRDS